MSLDRCLFVARARRAADREELGRRVERLARWHGGTASWAPVGEQGVAGAVRYDERSEPLDRPLAFGEEVADPANPAEGASAVLSVSAEGASLVGGAGGPGMMFEAASGEHEVWSTHAVAAAFLADGRARVDATAIPEQLAAEFVGGARSLIEGAVALESGVRVTLRGGAYSVEDHWPMSDRWAPVPEDEAAAHAERHLLASLERRVPAGACASLTAGLDSRVVAVALRELGVAPRTFTWGEPDWDDVRGGAAVARALGFAHEPVGVEWLPDDAARRELQRQVRWNEGAMPASFARFDWPPAMPAFVTGAGGETGRAFYYRDVAPAAEAATEAEVADTLVRLLEPRLSGARREALDALAHSVRGWVAAAAATGIGGWRVLDVVYGEQRVRRWLRGMLPRLDAPMIPAFATPEIGRALASLPLDQRLSDGFHLGFLARHAPDLVPRRPPPARRALRERLPGRFRPAAESPFRERWRENPGFRDWIAHDVLGSPLLAEPLGERWVADTRRRFLAGEAHAEVMALAAGGPVALAEALEELNRDG